MVLLNERTGKMKGFTEDEKVIARNVEKNYNWIARDSDGRIYIYRKKPTKLKSGWNKSSGFGQFFVFNYMFKSVKWKDDEPTRISDIYNPQILDDVERKYLKTVLKPFHDEVTYVEKSDSHMIDGGTYDKEYLHIKLYDGEFTFPDFDKGKMYSGMELDKKYTLNELGITYDD